MCSLRYIDLFAGCGGLSLGLSRAGHSGIFAVEKNTDAFSTLRHNLIDRAAHFRWPKWLALREWDIDRLLAAHAEDLARMRGSVDLLAGGPPCQGFSTAGLRRHHDKRNQLVDAYLAVVELVQPRAIMFENVRGFTMRFGSSGAQQLLYSEWVIERLAELGYADARGQLLDMSDFGVPQRRVRFILAATRQGQAGDFFSALDARRKAWREHHAFPARTTARMALADLERRHGEAEYPEFRLFRGGILGRKGSSLQRLLRHDPTGTLPDSHRFVNHDTRTIRVFQRMLDNAPRNRCIMLGERARYGLRKRSATVLAPNEPAPTVTTIPDDFIHYSEPRVLTVRECARLQTFPDSFDFLGPFTTGGKNRRHQLPRYSQVGNAVPPLFAEQSGLAWKEVLEGG